MCWLVDPAARVRPAKRFLDDLDDAPAAEILAVLKAVRDGPPPAFRGGGKWEAMHDDMAGFYEVRVRHGQWLHRLFCILDRSTDEPTLLAVSGGTKPNRRPMPQAVYDEAKRLRDVFEAEVAQGRPNRVMSC